MDALIALTGPESAVELTGAARRMLDALWPASERTEAVYTADGIAIASARTASGTGTLGPPRLRVAGDVLFAQRFDWPAVGGPPDEGEEWLAMLGSEGPEASPPSVQIAGVAWNAALCALTVLGDPMGESPFWYAAEGARLAVATHPAALLVLDWVTANPDPRATTPGWVLRADESRWLGIQRLPPGHLLVASGAGLRTRRWCSLNPARLAADPRDQEAWFALTRDALVRAVTRRMPVGGVIGSQLSGGLDSSAVALVASRTLRAAGRDLHTFSHIPPVRWNPPQPGDETPYVEAALACMANAVPHLLTGETTEPSAPNESLHSGHDREVGATAKAAGVLCMLSGWGGDEGVSYNGDGVFAGELFRGRFLWVIRWCHRFGGGTLRGAVGTFRGKVIYQQLGWLRPTAVHRVMPREEVQRVVRSLEPLLRDELLARRAAQQRLRQAASAHENQRRLLASPHLANRIGSDVEWSIPAGFCFRYPLLDPDLVSLVLAVPEPLFVLNGRTRTLLRQAMVGIYPEAIQRRHGKFVSHPRRPTLVATDGPKPL
jgi:asparagine synthase (glutamine-hydrolysing)